MKERTLPGSGPPWPISCARRKIGSKRMVCWRGIAFAQLVPCLRGQSLQFTDGRFDRDGSTGGCTSPPGSCAASGSRGGVGAVKALRLVVAWRSTALISLENIGVALREIGAVWPRRFRGNPLELGVGFGARRGAFHAGVAKWCRARG